MICRATDPRRRSHRAGVVAGVLLIGVAVGCSNDGVRSAASSTDPESGGQVVELDSADSLAEVLSSLGGPTVEDTEIRFAEGDDHVSIGGLVIAHPMFAEMTELDVGADNSTTGIWRPTLDYAVLFGYHNRVALEAEAAADGNVYHPTDEELYPDVGLAVFGQTTMVTDDESRAAVFEAGFWYLSYRDLPYEVRHQSETTHPDNEVTCWVEIRRGHGHPDLPRFDMSIILFAGPGIASSGMILEGPWANDDAVTTTGDIVESVCGTRPEGL